MTVKKDAEVARIAGLPYWGAGEARVVVEAWRRSGEGLGAFAERHGIHPRRVSRWAGKLDLEGDDEPLAFHPVRLLQGREPVPDGASLEIEVGAGFRVRVAPGFAAEDLARVLEVLGVRAGC